MVHTKQRKPLATMPKPSQHPFPTQQMVILGLCRIVEPIAFVSVFPYIYYMVESFNITSDPREISIYTGMITSAFALAEFSTGFVWGRISDRIGRKPVLLTGLAGTGLSMLIFGFAPNYPVALLARALGGILNGNIGVLQTTVAELVKVKEQQARAYSIMPFVWCIGAIIGSLLGGTLADPIKNHPAYFQKGTILEKFPFLLPNLISAAVVVCGVAIGILFLEETHEEKRKQRDRGLELGSWILNRLRCGGRLAPVQPKPVAVDESTALLRDEAASDYTSGASTPIWSGGSKRASDPQVEATDVEEAQTHLRPSFRKAFSNQVILHIVAYGILAYHAITLDQLLPVIMSLEDSPDEQRWLPFKFTGGFGLSANTIGLIFAIQGLYTMVFQVLLLPWIIGKLGSLRTFRMVVFPYALLYLMAPYVILLPPSLRIPGLALVIVWKVSFSSLGFVSNTLLLTNSVPSLLVLGSVNGVAASAASLARGIGPTISGIIFSAGLDHGYFGLSLWTSAGIAIIGAVESLWIEEPRGRFDDVERVEGNHPITASTSQRPTAITETVEGGMTMIEEEALAPASARLESKIVQT